VRNCQKDNDTGKNYAATQGGIRGGLSVVPWLQCVLLKKHPRRGGIDHPVNDGGLGVSRQTAESGMGMTLPG